MSIKNILGLTALAMGIFGDSVMAACTGGPGWTPEEFAEYLTLNDTTGWSGLNSIKYCTTEDLEEEAAASGVDLEARSGGNQWIGFSSSDCTAGYIETRTNFGCGLCVIPSNFIYSGYLWREGTGNPYPTADYYTSACAGTKLHHQGIVSGSHSSCNAITRAASVLLYQGC
ncbi:hypothetical protein C7974DRAFT_8695 [Boeremia exigua]|uniref:uncharacterized protein n=1 Tax=Boeremia exigua TaxID=749465 RepID=UPI001E8EBA65|nr:uncharacterized protein C7974DRAFT_8695 [Boeremia exigua]KAH6643881.1 hypothetical protein C7974DRAFT_8695 [Boeremia exigua]